MEKAPKWKQNEHPLLRFENTKKARFCPFLDFKVPKRTKKRTSTHLLSRSLKKLGSRGIFTPPWERKNGGNRHENQL